MNRKAMIMLYICVFGFIAAAFLFFRYSDKYTPNGDLFLGEKQIAVFEAYQTADEDIYYIQHSALLCSKKATKENFKSDFESCLNEYLPYLKYTSSDFQITYSSSIDKTLIFGKSNKQLVYTNEVFTYKINPYFKVEVPFVLESNLFV